MSRLFIICCFLFVVPSLTFGQATDVQVETAAVQVVRKIYGENFKGLKPLNAQKTGTVMVLMMQSPKGGIIKVLTKDSKLESFTDDKGTSLLGEKKFDNGLGSFPKVAEDGKAAMIEIKGTKLPMAGAKSLRAKGTLTLAVATMKKTVKSKPFAVKVDEKVSVGDLNFVIKKVGKPGFGKQPLEISLQTTQDVTGIASYAFQDASGKVIASIPSGTSRFGFNNNYTVTASHRLEKKVDKCVLVIELWTDKRNVAVPFDLSGGVGG